jgi:hypothetical protein
MSNINIENLSYDMNMDREAMEAIAGAWGGWAKRWAKKTFRSARKAYSRIKRLLCKVRRPSPLDPYSRHCRR